MKVILADPAIKKALISISPTSRQNQLIRQMCHLCLYRAHRRSAWSVLLTTLYYLIYILIMPEIDVQKFLPLKTQWFHIMLSLAGGEQHGYGIMQDVLDRTDGKVRLWPATLYGSIKRLIEAELIEESDERPAPELDDARRRYYRLTALGRRVLDGECERLQELVRIIRVKQDMVTE